MALPTFPTRLVSELRRRGVVKVVVSYAVAVFVLLQVAEITFAPLGLPEWSLRAAVVLAIAGFPVVFVLAWVYDLTLRRPGRGPGTRGSLEVEEPPERHVPPGRSVAVLAFEDMSPEGDQAFFCDGIAEEILDRLARSEQLKVASRTSSFRFKGRNMDVSEIASRLKVDAVLEGSVRKSGNRLRVSTQLVSARDGYSLWSQSFDRQLADVFEIQEEIARSVADALEVTLTAPAPEAYATQDIRAYELYLKAGHYFRRWGQRNVEFAADMFAKAVEVDPTYARGWAALANSCAMISMYWSLDESLLRTVDRASRRALDLAPDLGEAHVARGLHHVLRKEPELAGASFDRALELDPRLFEALYFYGRVCFQEGKLERAARLFEEAERARPEDFQTPILLRQVYRTLGRRDDALAAARRGVERAAKHLDLNPDDTRALNLGFGGLVDLQERDRAIEWAERSLKIDGDNADTLYNLACGFALMGEKERALDYLERACLRGVMIAEWVENDSDLDPLRGDPRFVAILEDLRARQVACSPDPGTA